MAIAKSKFPLDEITGVLGQVDRSVGKDGGLALCMGKSSNSTILGVKTKRTTTRSPAQIERAAIYCACDKAWESLSFWKKLYTCTYRKKVQGKSTQRFSNYLCWMSICLGNEWDENLFRMNSYVSRYVIQNTSGTTWTDHKVTLINIPTKTAAGIDLTVQQTDYKRLPQNIIHHKVNSKGSVIVCLPEMPPGKTIYVDVYSYGNYSTVQNCPVASRAEIDEDILTKTTFTMSAYWAYDIDIAWTAPYSGYVYWFFFEMWDPGNIDISKIVTDFPIIEFIGLTTNKCYYTRVNVYCMGFVNAGQTYNASGRVEGAGEDICGSPAAAAPDRFTYPPTPPLTASRQHMTAGMLDTCGGSFLPYECYIVKADAYPEITPESITKIGPTW